MNVLVSITILLCCIEMCVAIKCYNCLYMEVKGGEKYGDKACKENGLDYMESENAGGWICKRDEHLQPYTVYSSQAVPWSQILAPNQAKNYGDWSCQKSTFTLKSKASNDEMNVWYRGCQPITKNEESACGDDITANIRDIVVFKEIFAEITDTPLDKVTVAGDECLCKHYLCNASQSLAFNWIAMVTALVAAILVLPRFR